MFKNINSGGTADFTSVLKVEKLFGWMFFLGGDIVLSNTGDWMSYYRKRIDKTISEKREQ